MQLDLLPAGKHAANDGHTPIAQFFINVQILANSNKQQAVILFSMLFTLVIWVISALSLAIAALMYILFLWHHIPSRDRGLSGYCRRKIDSRLSKIVGVKVKKALEKEDTITRKGGARGPDSTGRPSMKRQPTIPDLQTNPEDRLPQMPMLTRHSTETTMTEYHTRSSTPEDHAMVGLHRQATAPHRPLPPSRTATQSSVNSVTSFASNAPLIGRQSSTGYVGRKATILPTPLPPNYPNIHGGSQRPPLNRSMTGDSQTTRGPYPSVSRPLPSQIQITPPNIGLPSRQGTNWSAYALPHYASPSASKFQMQSLTPGSSVGRSPTDGGYVAFNPLKYAASYKEASNSSPIDSQGRPPHRNLTAPIYQRPNEHVTQPRPPQRSGTAPLPQPSTYDESIYDSYYRPDDDFMRPSMPTRAATAGPSGFQEGWNGQRRAVPGHYQHDCRNTRF
ncbi:hypothetical protein MMC16_001808 [Acarospora aff. strigata]|nr:hypothetical protein [Acarospora aff. strigata]